MKRINHGTQVDSLRSCAIPNTGINRLCWRDGRLEILGWADDAHLAPRGPQRLEDLLAGPG
jgi:probable phosphoglycerate mutase